MQAVSLPTTVCTSNHQQFTNGGKSYGRFPIKINLRLTGRPSHLSTTWYLRDDRHDKQKWHNSSSKLELKLSLMLNHSLMWWNLTACHHQVTIRAVRYIKNLSSSLYQHAQYMCIRTLHVNKFGQSDGKLLPMDNKLKIFTSLTGFSISDPVNALSKLRSASSPLNSTVETSHTNSVIGHMCKLSLGKNNRLCKLR